TRYTNVSVKFFALYLSSRFRTVNKVSLAGRANAKFPARRNIKKLTNSHKLGAAPKLTNPATLNAGRMARVTPTPSHFRSLPVRNSCARIVKIFTTRSILAKNAVRAVRSEKAPAAILTCWKYRKVEVVE